jgi:hypothetical protein
MIATTLPSLSDHGSNILWRSRPHGWTLESVEPFVIIINFNFKDAHFNPGDPKAWFVVAKRA